MGEYNLNTEEIMKVVTLYSQIPTAEKRIFAQGYLRGLSAFPPVGEIGTSFKKKLNSDARTKLTSH